MVGCPWCHEDVEPTATVAFRAPASFTAACPDCGRAARDDWMGCPWCLTRFRWSLPDATRSLKAVLEEAGAPALARRVRLRYSGSSFVLDGNDRIINLATDQLNADNTWVERFRRSFGMLDWFAADHALHIPLHECGHVFEHFLRNRRLLEGVAYDHFGDLDAPYPDGFIYNVKSTVAGFAIRGSDFVSAYATVHPCEDVAETFAVAVFLRCDRRAILSRPTDLAQSGLTEVSR